MKIITQAPKITSICFALPNNIKKYDDDMAHLGAIRLKAVKKAVGVNQRYISDDNTFASDLGIAALKEALKLNNLKNNDIDALIVASCTPDYNSPKLSNMIAHGADLAQNVFCADYFGFCNSFVTTLAQASMLLEHTNRVAIVCADVQSKAIDPNADTQNLAITSDNACAIILEKSDEKMYFVEESYLNELMDMSNFISIYRGNDKLSITNNELVFKTFFEHFTKLYNDFSSFAPKSDINIIHAAIKFFQDRVKTQSGLDFFNKSLERFACLHLGDIPMNLLLANDEMELKNKRALLISHGTGMTINMANLPLDNFKSKIVFI